MISRTKSPEDAEPDKPSKVMEKRKNSNTLLRKMWEPKKKKVL